MSVTGIDWEPELIQMWKQYLTINLYVDQIWALCTSLCLKYGSDSFCIRLCHQLGVVVSQLEVILWGGSIGPWDPFVCFFLMDNVNELFCHHSRTRTCLHRSTLRHIMWSVLRECSAVHPNLPPSQCQREPNYNLTGPRRETLIAIYSFFFFVFSFHTRLNECISTSIHAHQSVEFT